MSEVGALALHKQYSIASQNLNTKRHLGSRNYERGQPVTRSSYNIDVERVRGRKEGEEMGIFIATLYFQ